MRCIVWSEALRQQPHAHFRLTAYALTDVVCVADVNAAGTTSLDFTVVLDVQTRKFLCIRYRCLVDSG